MLGIQAVSASNDAMPDLPALSLQTEAAPDAQAPSGSEVLANVLAAAEAAMDAADSGVSQHAGTIGIIPGGFGAYLERGELAMLRAIAGLGAASVAIPGMVSFDHSIATPRDYGIADAPRLDPPPCPTRPEDVRTRNYRMGSFSRYNSNRSGKPAGSKLWKKAKKGKV